MSERRLPPPWSVEETNACFIVRDANRQALAFVYCEGEPGRRAAAKLLTRDEARRIATNIAKLPGAAAQALRTRAALSCRSTVRPKECYSALGICGAPGNSGPPHHPQRPGGDGARCWSSYADAASTDRKRLEDAVALFVSDQCVDLAK